MEKDLQKKKYLYDTERFADLINGTVCQGKQLVAAKDLSDMDGQVIRHIENWTRMRMMS